MPIDAVTLSLNESNCLLRIRQTVKARKFPKTYKAYLAILSVAGLFTGIEVGNFTGNSIKAAALLKKQHWRQRQ